MPHTPDPSLAGPIKSSFAAVVDRRTEILVLGSLPGDASLRAAQYYAHPRNQFWALMAPVVGAPLVEMPYAARLSALLDVGVGLWDVIRSAERAGSLDAAIRDHRANDLVSLVDTLPALKAIAFNGSTAAAIGRRALAGLCSGVALVSLPSSSPAQTLAFDRKAAAWATLRPFLDGRANPLSPAWCP